MVYPKSTVSISIRPELEKTRARYLDGHLVEAGQAGCLENSGAGEHSLSAWKADNEELSAFFGLRGMGMIEYHDHWRPLRGRIGLRLFCWFRIRLIAVSHIAFPAVVEANQKYVITDAKRL